MILTPTDVQIRVLVLVPVQVVWIFYFQCRCWCLKLIIKFSGAGAGARCRYGKKSGTGTCVFAPRPCIQLNASVRNITHRNNSNPDELVGIDLISFCFNCVSNCSQYFLLEFLEKPQTSVMSKQTSTKHSLVL